MLIRGSAVADMPFQDSLGVIRSFGDQTSWFSSCVVVGDGSWAITSWDAVNEKMGPNSFQTVRNPVFISAYTGQAWQCEVRTGNKDLNVALIKLPVAGLPAAPLAQWDEFVKPKTKVAYCTLGELMSGEPIGNRWPTQICGISREKTTSGYALQATPWDAAKAFVTDIDKYKWLFLIDVSPNKPVPNGSIISHGSTMVGMYLNKLTITSGDQKQVFGRCAISTEIAKYAGEKGLDTAPLYSPPAATTKPAPGADVAFQLQTKLYTAIAVGRSDLVVEYSKALAKLLPDDPQVRMLMGAGLTGTGKFDEAIKTFDECAKLDPKLPGLRVNRALALVSLKKNAEAEAELLKAAEESPSDTRPLIALADLYLADEKTLDKAYTYAKNVTTIAPDSPAARLLLAKVEKNRKNIQPAIDAIGEAIKLAPDWADGWLALGSTFEAGGDKPNAEKAYRKLVEKQPQNPAALLALASFLADQGKKDEPLELIGKVRAITPAPPKEVLDAAKALEDQVNKGK